ncbi:hypothetical protein Tco_0877650 [Tanacetum coccineum]|uniref:Uncharacterized protein n=1 Tax=Tanacetum coccineum TaxID=301880 RepID=A0ABQ5C0X9_9ASTR
MPRDNAQAIEGSEDEGPNSKEEEEAAPEGQQQQAVQVVDTTIDEPFGLGYGAAIHHALQSTKEKTPSTFGTRCVDAQRATMWRSRKSRMRVVLYETRIPVGLITLIRMIEKVNTFKYVRALLSCRGLDRIRAPEQNMYSKIRENY